MEKKIKKNKKKKGEKESNKEMLHNIASISVEKLNSLQHHEGLRIMSTWQ